MHEPQEQKTITGPRAEQLIALQDSARVCKLVAKFSGVAWLLMLFMGGNAVDGMGAYMSTAKTLVVLAVAVAIFRSHQIEQVICQAGQEK